MRAFGFLFTIIAIAFSFACDERVAPNAFPIIPIGIEQADATDDADGSTGASLIFDDVSESDSDDSTDNCRRWIPRTNGGRICLDDLLPALLAAHPADNDGDGIPNINDDDIDGDGIPNGDDLDVDGDGIPNGYDDDIDGDGVDNENDVDIDGDFIRNRWDPDIDGDLIYNPHDFDADADGLVTLTEVSPIDDDCGAAKIFQDEDECDPDKCDDSSAANKESKCKDKGKQSGNGADDGQNITLEDIEGDAASEDPTTTEQSRVLDEFSRAFEETGDRLLEIAAMYEAAADNQRLDAIIAILDAAIAEDEPDGTYALREEMSEEAHAALEARRRTLEDFNGPTQGRIDEAVDMAGRIAAAARLLAADQDELRDSLLTVDENVPGTTLLEDGAVAATLHEISDEAELNPSGVQEAIAPTARTALLIGSAEAIEPTWRSVANRAAEQKDAITGAERFELRAVALVAEAITIELDVREIEIVDESLDNVLDATAATGLSDPLMVVNAVIERAESDPTVSLRDGISPAEAQQGAVDAMN